MTTQSDMYADCYGRCLSIPTRDFSVPPSRLHVCDDHARAVSVGLLTAAEKPPADKFS